jgi:hypothetical protein
VKVYTPGAVMGIRCRLLRGKVESYQSAAAAYSFDDRISFAQLVTKRLQCMTGGLSLGFPSISDVANVIFCDDEDPPLVIRTDRGKAKFRRIFLSLFQLR